MPLRTPSNFPHSLREAIHTATLSRLKRALKLTYISVLLSGINRHVLQRVGNAIVLRKTVVVHRNIINDVAVVVRIEGLLIHVVTEAMDPFPRKDAEEVPLFVVEFCNLVRQPFWEPEG